MNITPWAQLQTIALIDPDPQSYQAVQTALADRFQFISATTSETALRMANGQPIWLWLISAHLPDISGADFCRLLRMRDPNIRLAVVGEAGVPDDEIACRMAGVHYFFCKPLDPRMFAEFVDQIGRSGLRTAHRVKARRVQRGDATRANRSPSSAAITTGKRHLL
jgi:DNA-binding response OmpR family regulator